ncbi:MAG: hypothetical protein AAGA96_08295 [Verrucomicrobiota bacterium]
MPSWWRFYQIEVDSSTRICGVLSDRLPQRFMTSSGLKGDPTGSGQRPNPVAWSDPVPDGDA